jgi:hypothetical protein
MDDFLQGKTSANSTVSTVLSQLSTLINISFLPAIINEFASYL